MKKKRYWLKYNKNNLHETQKISQFNFLKKEDRSETTMFDPLLDLFLVLL